jgi:hypothetical protein
MDGSMTNKIDHAIARAITQYSKECEDARISRDVAEQIRRVQAVLTEADPLDVLASAYFESVPAPLSVGIIRSAVLSMAGRSVDDEADDDAPAPEPKPRKSSKKKDAD